MELHDDEQVVDGVPDGHHGEPCRLRPAQWDDVDVSGGIAGHEGSLSRNDDDATSPPCEGPAARISAWESPRVSSNNGSGGISFAVGERGAVPSYSPRQKTWPRLPVLLRLEPRRC